ncbi:gliding motility-associated C-terminal domain-containing protein [Flavobacterium cerinum]|uniref:Gliding motility-associated C-terminal domain-containing protein n=1 Tax=Flavobacterium cerinum TaxID=2502784 RepID=A0ABY5IVD2_9FLAO|nr:gliding motility-associated C-terminal domain-containing protein [Flavobacterium cerinum]UUC45482.1 gliding motility-associated C-terminal domain-containing protein [Flavobacterium cerinum]
MAQDISLFNQFNGRYDFTFIGNTLNPEENSFQLAPTIFTSSSATLNLASGNTIEKAYLYWAGSGPGDFDIKLNNTPIRPDRTFSYQRNASGIILDYFSAFKDVTDLVLQFGNGTFTVSDLDVTPYIAQHFIRRTNFAGWAIIVVYKNEALPLNQLNVYDGMQAVPDEISITLSSLNVIDNQNAKIGFLAWEGDKDILINETLRINGNILSNPPLNPENNAFNGTNSITGSDTLYNMDLDVYDIQNNIDIGDTSATIQLTSGQDFVMINAIVTKLNSQLPDASISIDHIETPCNSRTVNVDFTVYNLESTNPLPQGTRVKIYANDLLAGTYQTLTTIVIDGYETQSVTLLIPETVTSPFTLKAVVDPDNTVTEIDENNNDATVTVTFLVSPQVNPLQPIKVCNKGDGTGYYDFSTYEALVKTDPSQTVSFHESDADAHENSHPIYDTHHYFAAHSPKEIFVRVADENCYTVTSFILRTYNCPPTVYNAVSANGDGLNDTFFIKGLRTIFLNFELYIYNRWGKLVWSGDHHSDDWNGLIKDGIGNQLAPEGTYFYILKLNDPDYPDDLTGFLYLTR